jgi:beta-glucosidase
MTRDTSPPTFGSNFLWGTATAAYQIEGATTADGRGASIWDRFAATPGKIRNGESGAIACDFYHRYRSDIALMRELGVNAFRLSVAWPRVVPDGRGRVNEAGLDFYDRIVDELLANGIEPLVTLYHWDLPLALEEAGGWPVRGTAEAFGEYAEVVARRLGDRVKLWLTQNEPWVAAWLGYAEGIHAPGRTSVGDAVAAAHHLLLSHGIATEILRRECPDARIGVTLDLEHADPASDDPDDLAACLEFDGARNRWFLDPVLRGRYPADMLELRRDVAPPVRDADLEAIAAPIDFLGINYYQRRVVERGPDGLPRFVHQPDSLHTEMGWEVSPQSLVELLVRIDEEYAPPAILITENGAAFSDVRAHDGGVRDPERVAYVEAHIAAIGRAVAAGVPVEGYFLWTLLDNFEWSLGYGRRFGIVYVDFATQERVPKQSFHRYQRFLAEVGARGRLPLALASPPLADLRAAAGGSS